MNTRQKQKVTLAILVASAIIPIGLSFFAEPISNVLLASVGAFIVTLFSGIAWVYPERMRGNAVVLRQKRRVLIACLALIVSVPLTHWPLRISFAVSRQALSDAANQAETRFAERYEKLHGLPSQRDPCGGGSLPASRNEPIHARAGMFYLGSYSNGSMRLYSRGGRERHSAFQHQINREGFWTPHAVDLGGWWQFVELPH